MPSVDEQALLRAPAPRASSACAPRYILRLTFCSKLRGLRGEGAAAADPDRAADRAGARAAGALLRPRLLAAAAHFGARLLRLGAGAAGRAVRGHDLVHQRLVERAPNVASETCERPPRRLTTLSFHAALASRLLLVFGRAFLPRPSCRRLAFLGAAFGRDASARRAAFAAVRTITWPPSAPGTAPRISSRLRSASTRTTFRFSVVARTTPMWPDMRLPGNTRPGVWRWPIEPGARCDSELPCDAYWPREVVALDRAGEALADRDAGDVDELARLEQVDLDLGAGLQLARLRRRRGGTPSRPGPASTFALA